MGACNTDSVNTGANQQVTLPMTLPQTQGSWQAFIQQLQSVLTLAQQGNSRPASSSTPIQYATFFSSTLPAFQTSGCTVTADNTWSLFGGYSLKVAVTAPNAYVIFGASGYPFPLPPNEQWLSSCYVKASTASAQFKMGFQTANGTYQDTVTTSAAAGTVTQPAIPLNMVADNASACTYRLDFPSASGTTFNFDGFQNEPSVTGTINPSPFLLTNIIAGSIAANMITVATLSALTANMGLLTAGVIQSIDGRFTVDCTNELITIKDSTSTTRMQIGQISAGVYDIKIWNAAGTLLFDAANGLQYAGAPTQVTQVINNNAGNGQLNVNPTGGVVSLLPYNNHATPVTTTIASTVDANNSYLQHGTVFDAHIGGVKVDTLTDATYARPLATALTTGQVDLSKAGVINKTGANITYTAGGTLDSLKPAQVNADQTSLNTSNDTSNVSGTPSSSVALSSVTGHQINLIPDPDIKAPGIYWPDYGSGVIVVNQYIDGHTNCFEYVGTGSPSGIRFRASLPIPVNPGTTYTLSAVVVGSGITAGNAYFALVNTAITVIYGSFNITSASSGRLSTQITIPAGVTQVIALFNTSNCTVASGGSLALQQPQLEAGSIMTAFRTNIGDNLSGTVGIDFSKSLHLNANVGYLGGVQGGTCYDGQVITFNPTYPTPPLVLFSGGGMSYSSAAGSAVSQSQQFTASSLSTTGFTASLKLVTGGTLTAQTDSFTTVTVGSEYECTLTNAPAYNNQYTVNFTLSLGAASGGTVYIRETSISGTILWSRAYLTAQNGNKSITVTWSGATGTSVIDLSLVLSEGTGTISATNVQFTSGTSPTTYSAVPSTAPIQWIAYPSS